MTLLTRPARRRTTRAAGTASAEDRVTSRIVTGPDGSRWVSVDITEEQFKSLSEPCALDWFSRYLDADVRRHVEQEVDRSVWGVTK